MSPEHEDVKGHEDHLYNDLIEGELTFDWPASFNAVKEECAAAREGVAIFDQSYFGKFMLSGPKADDAVKWLCGADVTQGEIGRVTYTPLCNKNGGVEADLTVTKLGTSDIDSAGNHRYYFAAGGSTATKDWEWIVTTLEQRGYSRDDIILEDMSEDLSIISVQGPHSRNLLQRLLPKDGKLDLSDNEMFPFSTARSNLSLNGIPVEFILRLTFVGEVGYELHVGKERAVSVYDALRAAGDAYGKEHSVPVRDAGYRAIDSLSAEKGYRHWHADLSNRDTPMEAGIGFTVLPRLKRITAASEARKGKECDNFLGRDALEKHRSDGITRKLICLVLEDPKRALHGQETIWRDGACVGYACSTAFGHTVGKTVVYGYVEKTNENEDGATRRRSKVTNKWLRAGMWKIGNRGELLAARIHLKAPFDPTNSRVRGEYD